MELYKLEKIKKIYKSYNNSVVALTDIDLTIKESEIVVILGPSGSGKSTLLNILSGIDIPTSGKIYFDGERIDCFTDENLLEYRRENIGFIFQNYNLVPNLTVYENIELGSELSDKKIPVLEMLSVIGLEKFQDKYPYQLSGGMMQRVAIARAVVKNSKVLFCDEPTGALDEVTGKKILQVLIDINKKYNTTIIIVTHNPSISKLANKIIKMNSGKIVEITTNKKVSSVENLRWS